MLETWPNESLFLDWLNEIVEEHEKTFDENNLRDFIDAFIVEKRKGKDDSFKVIATAVVTVTIVLQIYSIQS